ncbi:xanthine dehydrogenase family protein molybdopterin-binding subunit [Pacificimonas sp. WHA3]|uniref:Xanthine dehydrogenase family protein molybdopterin-binding subunit n=1 Tax=Pacificimonas pallii TaxID=2827236 RepID=A0ABS6SCE5_9SPHN|nr:molybdopterin cofactor-binding domain-containing protein [Pacificimonas pallii]MBV7255768.1 xanthine dehydrogenase family protein molybdopterin-binding subunit [Pacificimonas pallii]
MDVQTPKSSRTAAEVVPKRAGVTRRKLLIGAGAAAGLVIGYAVWPRHRSLNFPVFDDETLINGFLKIAADGEITVACPQAEMGQGVYTALPQLLAGELGADWTKVGVQPAPLHPLYANRGFVADAGASMPSLFAGIVSWAAVTVVERLELQATGGSTSIKAFWEPLRMAGAAAREMFIQAAARQFGVDPATLDTVNGFVEGDGRRASFAELVRHIDPDDAPAEPRLRGKPPLIGTPAPRLDTPAKVNGSAMFGADVRLADMVYAAIRAAPLGSGERATFGGQAAQQMQGVIDVVEGEGWYATVANRWWTARTALDLVDTEYESGVLAESVDIEADLQAALDDETSGETFMSVGDTAAAAGDADLLVADYNVPFLAHACLEPMTATVRINENGAEIWLPTQSQTLVAWKVADALDMPSRNVRVYPTFIGGGFGRKVEVDAAVQAATIAKAVGRPVQLIWHREEDMAHDMYRPAVKARMTGGIGADKRASVVTAKLAAPNLGASMMRRMMPRFAGDGDSAAMVKGVFDGTYIVPNISVSHVDVPTPVPLGYWRSVEHSYSAFFGESFMDELAARAGLDPLSFRLRHMDENGRAARVLMLAASRGTLAAAVPENAGKGIALHSSFGSHVAQVAEVNIPSPSEIIVRKVTCVIDCGQVVNPDIVRAQMEGSIIFGLTAALFGRIEFEAGEPTAQNFDLYPLLTMAETPEIDVHIIESDAPPGGVGEPGVPPIAPAVANAVFAATGNRLRTMPFLDR